MGVGVILMIFDNKNAAFRFLNSVHISEKEITKSHILPRAFCALSYRINSDTEIVSKGGSIKVKSGDITFFPANLSYSRISKKEELIAVHCEVFNDFTKEICAYTPKDSERFFELFRKIHDVYQKRGPGYLYEAGAIVNMIFMNICEERRNELKKHSGKFLTAVEYMNENFSNPQLTTKEIAAVCNVSEGYLRKIFRNEADISPKRYLNRLRVQRAVSLINCGFYSVAQVSEMVGFYDAKYFSTVYKKYAASSPSHYTENAVKY